MKRLLSLALLGGALAASSGCGSDDCIILANGGNKLCGDDARAWCDTTDGIRDSAGELANDPTFGDSSSASSVRESQDACDQIRGR